MAINLKNLIRPADREAADLTQLKAWTDRLHLANPPAAQAELIGQLGLLNGRPIPPETRLALLDQLQKPIALVQEACARRYTTRPLPLSRPEQQALQSVCQLRELMIEGYNLCVEESPPTSELRATALQRTLIAQAGLYGDQIRARCQPGSLFWQRLNRHLLLAESEGLATMPVMDPTRFKDKSTTPLAAYSEIALLHLAGPHELTLKHLHWIARWARRWAPKLELAAELDGTFKATPLFLDLASVYPPGYQPYAGPGRRLLITDSLRKSIKTRIKQLEAGKTPAELLLGEDCAQPACGQLLQRMYTRWCKGGLTRRLERHITDVPGRAIAGLEGILHHLVGTSIQAAKGTERPRTLAELRLEREKMATFGGIPSAELNRDTATTPPPIETDWRVVNESATGLSMTRAAASNGARLQHGQLLAVEVPGSPAFFLSVVRWMTLTGEGQLRIGVQLMPSPVNAMVAHPDDEPLNYCPAFLLPAAAGREPQPSLITAPGIFRPGRVLVGEGVHGRRFKLTHVIERGEDFERIGFE